jgi:DNA-binding NarL/FixJ family response regulator
MDLTIPGGMGGKEAMEELSKLDSGVRAIVSSGYSNDSGMSEFVKYGFRGFVVKPYRIEELSKIVREAINGG